MPWAVHEQEMEGTRTTPHFMFFGDAIVEGLQGTYLGNSWELFDMGPKFWRMYFESYSAIPMGIAGQETLLLPSPAQFPCIFVFVYFCLFFPC
jgi:hypothetical protein